MRTESTFTRLLAAPAVLAIFVTCSGCDFVSGAKGLVSGANLKPTVRYRPSTNEATEAAAAASASTESAAAESASAAGVGTLKGKIEFEGKLDPLPPLYAKGGDVKDAAVCAAVEAPNETILVKNGGLANVFIYLRKAPKNVPAPPTEAVILDQKYCTFKPHATIIRIGQTVKVLNSDAVAHNTNAGVKKNSSFNTIVTPNDAGGVPLIYKTAEQDPISIGCDIHPWMRAYHLPIDHPYAALSGEDGTFEIKDLPAGKHEFKIWHEVGGLLEKSLVVTIKPGDNELTYKVKPSQVGK